MLDADPAHASALSAPHSEVSLTPYWLGAVGVCALFFVFDLVCQWWLIRTLWPAWFESLSAKARVECANRFVSTIHAFTVALGALYLLDHRPDFFSDITYGWSPQAMRLVTIYSGYCAYDVIITALHHHTLLPHFSIYFHHFLTLIMALICLSYRGGYLPLATCYLVNELSTPFLNFRWAFKKTSPHAGRAEEEDPTGADLEANVTTSLRGARGRAYGGELDAEDGALLSDDEDMDKLDAALENIKKNVLRRQERDKQVADITAAHSVGTPRGPAAHRAPPAHSPRDREVAIEPISLCCLEFASGHDLWACVNLIVFLLLFVVCRFLLNGFLSFELILRMTGRKPTGYPLPTGTTIFIHALCHLFFLLNAFWLVGIQKVARRELAQMAKPKGHFASI